MGRADVREEREVDGAEEHGDAEHGGRDDIVYREEKVDKPGEEHNHRDAEPCRTGLDGLAQAERTPSKRYARARVLVQRGLELSKLQAAPGPLLHERRGERVYQAQREAKEPENIDTSGR